MLMREPPEDPRLGVTCVNEGTMVMVSNPVTVMGDPSVKYTLMLVEVRTFILTNLNTASVSVKVTVS